MNAREVERELTLVLHRHAEDAMNRTDTQDEHRTLQAEVEDRTRRRHRRVVGGAVAAGVAAAVAFALWPSDLGDHADSGPAGKAQTPEVAVAQRFVEAVAAGDVAKVRSYLPPAARADWQTQLRFDEAVSRRYLLERCGKESSSATLTTVYCPFDVHVLHSEQLGLGPFRYNTFTVDVEDGRIVSVKQNMASGANGEDQIVQRLRAWVRKNHPEQFDFMWTQRSMTPAQSQRYYRLLNVYSQEYADAMTQGAVDRS